MNFLNRVGFSTATTGTGAIDVGAALAGYATPAEAGAVNGRVYEYVAEDGDDFEIGVGTYSSSGPAISRDTVKLSKIAGTAGTTKLTLSGTATVRLTATAESLADWWSKQPLAVPVPIQAHLFDNPADALPSKDQSYRYVLLTAGEDGSGEYNEGILTGESVTGSAPLVVATAVIDLAGSPFHGKTIHLINTERRVLRAGSPGTVENDQIQNITGNIARRTGSIRLFSSDATVSGAFSVHTSGGNGSSGSAGIGAEVNFDASRVARAGTETRVKNIGVTYVMRIL